MKSIKEMLLGNQSEKLTKAAKQIFQIEEFDGELYLTYNCALICPTEMFADNTLDALEIIRDLYVKRNTKSHG